jgi:hypothetical protein
MWTVPPQRSLHSAGICSRHRDIRDRHLFPCIIQMYNHDILLSCSLLYSSSPPSSSHVLLVLHLYSWIKKSSLYRREEYLYLRERNLESKMRRTKCVRRRRLHFTPNRISMFNHLTRWAQEFPLRLPSPSAICDVKKRSYQLLVF